MIVSCPSCSTRFVVDPAALGAEGRRVRCARCGHVWRQEARPEAAPADVAPAESLEPRPLPPGSNLPAIRSVETRRPDRGWILFAAVVVLLPAAILFGQNRIVGAWPPAERLYRVIGMATPAAGEGLLIRDISPEARLEEGERLVAVEGRVVNMSGQALYVPSIRVALTDEEGKVLSSSRTEAGRAHLDPGESASFVVEFSDPAEDATRITLVFERPDAE